MKVKELRHALQALGLSTAGRKAELEKRLAKAQGTTAPSPMAKVMGRPQNHLLDDDSAAPASPTASRKRPREEPINICNKKIRKKGGETKT